HIVREILVDASDGYVFPLKEGYDKANRSLEGIISSKEKGDKNLIPDIFSCPPLEGEPEAPATMASDAANAASSGTAVDSGDMPPTAPDHGRSSAEAVVDESIAPFPAPPEVHTKLDKRGRIYYVDSTGTRILPTKRPPHIPGERWNKLSPKEKQVEIDRYQTFLSTTKDGASGGAPTAGESPGASSSALPVAIKYGLCPLGARALLRTPRPTATAATFSRKADAGGDVPVVGVVDHDQEACAIGHRPGDAYPSSGTSRPAARPAPPSLACPVLADDVPRMPLDSLTGLHDLHRECIPKDDSFVHALVARTVGQAERMANPKARAALQSEWDKLRRQGVWDEKRVRPWAEVAAEARRQGHTVHVGRIFEICVEKNSELPLSDPRRKFKGRVVFQGNNVSDENRQAAIFQELSSTPATIEAA
ncbi:MAG: hypothetical protein EBV06_17865, partial [Planctomycetia bacterium]|nr:hypothetical protein [Planctomycetia bacterium]